MALSTRQVSDLLDVLGGERVGNWVASREGGGHAGWFIYLQHPDVQGALIAATPDWDGTDILPIELQYHGPGSQPGNWDSCNQTVPVPWTGRIDSDRKRWHYEVAKFIRCLGAPGGPLPSVDHGLPKSMQPTSGEWDAGAKARQAKIFRHILGLDDNPVGPPGIYRRTQALGTNGDFVIYYYDEKPTPRSEPVGTIQVSPGARPLLDRECRGDLRALEKAVGRKLVPFEIYDARLLCSRWLEKGLGVRMYADAIKHVAKNDGALLASSCFVYDRESGTVAEATSRDAMRVWKSKRLAEAVLVKGVAATAVGGQGNNSNPVGAGGGYFWEQSVSPEDLRSLQIGTGSEHGDLWVLRSETRKPHLLAEVVGGTVVDVRQRGNRPPTKHAKYIAALEAHLRSGREGNPVEQAKARLLAW